MGEQSLSMDSLLVAIGKNKDGNLEIIWSDVMKKVDHKQMAMLMGAFLNSYFSAFVNEENVKQAFVSPLIEGIYPRVEKPEHSFIVKKRKDFVRISCYQNPETTRKIH